LPPDLLAIPSNRVPVSAGQLLETAVTAQYPLLLDLTGRRVVVVGGGRVGTRRAIAAADAGGRVDVIAPDISPELASDQRIRVFRRAYQPGDVAGAWLVHACTGVPDVDDAVCADAEAARIWYVRAADAAHSSATVPAVARVDDVTIAVNAGGDPCRARVLRDAVQLALNTGALPLRRHRAHAGRVALVGGGPGDPELITVRGRRLLAEADVVVTDRLGPRALLAELLSGVEVIDVGKARDHHTRTQSEINELLVSLARQGKFVVRLKGGDPFVLGRGGEELAACVAAGVPCEVVPGVTSAIAVPASAGIPVTQRGVARHFTVLSGHDDVDWRSVVGAGGTLVILMGASRIDHIAKELVAAGLDESTPAAVVENGTLPHQRVTIATVGTIASRAQAVGVRPPAVLVVGDVVAWRVTTLGDETVTGAAGLWREDRRIGGRGDETVAPLRDETAAALGDGTAARVSPGRLRVGSPVADDGAGEPASDGRPRGRPRQYAEERG
jgi:uroporphyrin-III C-methyltransferase/precorrin-2 dehydrogenase/sirohydrochlorin ferrochelatase